MKTLVKINHEKEFSLINGISNQLREIVILDPTVPDSHHIASGIKPGTATYILETQPDAVEQITTILAQHTDIEAVHIISHGSSGSLYLGTTELNSSNIENYSQQLQQWRNSFTANATIILYGCNSAAGDRGHQFLTQLHQLTGATIAANSQTTGNSKLGGTWDIPQLIPPSSQAPKLAIAETTLTTYSGVLGFAPKVDFATGNLPYSVSIGDFNGDGLPDLAVANLSSASASILLNTTPTGAAPPTFAPKVDFPTDLNPRSVSIGDFNGDGLPDLAWVTFISHKASILINTTTTGAALPTFAPQVDFPTDLNPRSVSKGDFNGDGKPDLAVGQGDTASILLNTTTTGGTPPTFATKVTFPTGLGPDDLSIDDINSDGKPDLATANPYSDDTSILLNTTPTGATTPTFAPQVTFPTGDVPNSVSIGDFNSDGKPDLVLANVYSNDTSILLNTTPTGATTATFTPQVTFATGINPRSVSIGDFNGDGKPDLAVANVSSNNVSILLNTTATGAATPTFAPQVTFATGMGANSVSIGDFNGDGKPDLATANYFSDTVSILLNSTAKVTAVTATTADGSYGVGATIAITITFDAAVYVTGTPQLQLETGTTDQFATYTSGSDGTALTFNYVVQAGDTSLDLEYLATTALKLNGGTIKDNLTVDAILTLPTTASANSLGGSKAIVIDTLAPTVTLASTSATTVNTAFTVTATFSENVTGFDITDITVGNATVGNFITVDAKTYTFDVTPTVDGSVTVDIPAAKAKDTAGNNNTPATQLTRTADFTVPTANLGAISNLTTAGGTSQTLTVTFSDSSGVDVSSLDNSDVVVNWSGGTIPATFVSVDINSNGTPRTATYSFTPPGGIWDNADNGTYTVNLQASQVKDAVGNLSATSSLGTFGAIGFS